MYQTVIVLKIITEEKDQIGNDVIQEITEFVDGKLWIRDKLEIQVDRFG